MRIFRIVLLILSLTSCSNERITLYQYNNVVISRIDKGVDVYFYYGDYNRRDKDLPASFIHANYKGFDGSLGGYLIFHENNKVELKRMYGSFEKIGEDSQLFLTEINDNYIFNQWKDSIKGRYNNVIWISDLVEEEKEVAKRNKSSVQVKHL